MRRLTLLLPLVLAMSCDSDDNADAAMTFDTVLSADVGVDADAAPASPPLSYCESGTSFPYAPAASDILSAFPDDYLSVDDGDAATGMRVSLRDAPFLASQPDVFANVYRDLESLDGFGTSAGVMLRFDGPVGTVPGGEADSLSGDVLLLDIDSGERVPFVPVMADQDHTMILWPMVPLKPKRRYAAVVLRGFTAADGECISPSATLRSLLEGGATDPALTRLHQRYETLLTALDVRADALSAATVFTTQSILDASLAARDDILARTYRWSSTSGCVDEARYRRCQTSFEAWDYRREGYLGGSPIIPEPYELQVTTWLPPGPGPFPTIIFGHGLGGTSSDGRLIANSVAPSGYATVAISHPRHGDHPTASSDPNGFFIDLFGIDLGGLQLHGLQFRENLRQAALDKLQLVEVLAANPDVSGDGRPDLDTDALAYYGISLGGIMAADLLALTERVGAAILAVAGGRLISVITDGEDFGQFKDILATIAGGPDELIRVAPVAQTLIDAGDPVNYAPHVVHDRLDDALPPNVLQIMAIGDTVVPNITSRALARGLGLTHVPPVSQPVGVVAIALTAPVTGNLADGQRTGGLFQYDRVSFSIGGQPIASTHTNLFSSVELQQQTSLFLDSWLLTPPPQISDPYAELGSAPLP